MIVPEHEIDKEGILCVAGDLELFEDGNALKLAGSLAKSDPGLRVRFQLYGYRSMTWGPDGMVEHVYETADGREEWTEDAGESPFAGMVSAMLGEDGPANTWFYLSFADAELPKGQQFLGGAYVRAASLPEAITCSHQLGINPGGEVQVLGPLSAQDMDKNVPEEKRERLLSRDEVEP